MKIQLVAINAKYIHSNLAVYCLEAYAREYGPELENVQIERKEYTINHNSDDILAGIYRDCPQVVCFSCYIWNIQFVRELIKELHKLLPATEIWVGGPEVSYHAVAFLQEEPEVKGVMCQEGEETFLELCRYYEKEGELNKIFGITYREGKEIRVNANREVMDLNRLPFPYRNPEELKNRICYYESSRGCPFSCSYCLSSLEKELRFKNLEKVYKELDIFLQWKVPQVKFVDRTFNTKKEHAMGIWKYIKEHDNGVTNFHFEIAADILNEEELELLTSLRPGLVQLEIGVQSTNEATLKEVHRNTNLTRIRSNVENLLQANNCHVHLDLIAGLPYEDFERFKQSFRDVYDLHPHQLQLGFLKVLKGSYIEAHKTEYENLVHTRPPYEIMATKWMSFDEILKLKQVEEMVEIYYNSGQHKTVLGLLEKKITDSFSLYEELAEFFAEKNPQGAKLSRAGKMELLLAFAVSKDRSHKEMYEEAAIFDLYLRENLKSRPEGAARLTKEQCAFRKEHGAKAHMESFHYDFLHIEKTGVPQKQDITIVFHYDDRNPITWDAKTEVIK